MPLVTSRGSDACVAPVRRNGRLAQRAVGPASTAAMALGWLVDLLAADDERVGRLRDLVREVEG